MSNYQQGNRPQRRLTILDDFRMRLVGPTANGGERPAVFNITVKKNRPVLVVKTNIPGDKQFGQIPGEFDPVNFEMFLETLRNIERIEPGKRVACRISDYPFQQGGRSKELKLASTVFVGREADGTGYVAVVHWDQSRAVLKFPLVPSQFHSWIGEDGQPFTPALISMRFAPAYANTVGRIISNVLHSEYEAPAPRPQNGGGNGGYGGGNQGGGGYNNNSNGGGGNNQSSGGDFSSGGDAWPMG